MNTENELFALQERVRLLENLVNMWANHGAQDLFAGHGYQRFGAGGAMRLDGSGIQIDADAAQGASVPAIRWVQRNFAPDANGGIPSDETVYGVEQVAWVDELDIDDIFYQFQLSNNLITGPTKYVLNQAWIDSNSTEWWLQVKEVGNATATFAIISHQATDTVQFFFDGGVIVAPIFAADPAYIASIGDSAFYYRSDTDRFRVRANATMQNLAYESDVTNHTGDTTDAHDASAISVDSTTLVGVGTDVQAVLEELDNGIADHLADTSDAHDASAISVLDSGARFTGTDVEAVLAEIFDAIGGGGSGVITHPTHWAGGAGYEFWLVAGADMGTAAGAGNVIGLEGWGWTTTTLTTTEGSTGDFNTSADSDPTRFVFDANGDTLASPIIFGDYFHTYMASKFLGSQPTKLGVEFYARFSTATANETTSFMGFSRGNDATVTTAGAIVSDGANFRLRSTAGNDAGAAIDTSWHTFKIEVGATTTEWFIDTVSQGTITTEADIWPQSFRVRAGTTNRLDLAWARVYYA